MTVYDLTDVARLRLEDISFFGFLLLIATLGIRFLWNFLAKDFTRLRRLTFFKALSLTALLSLFMLLILVAAGPTANGAVLTKLPFGWWHFLKRNIPQLTYDWGLIATSVICTVGVLILGNCFMGALFRQFQKTQSSEKSPQKWRWSWSLAAYAAIWILFMIAFGAGGVLRHTTGCSNLPSRGTKKDSVPTRSLELPTAWWNNS
jgi:hypothetical protein